MYRPNSHTMSPNIIIQPCPLAGVGCALWFDDICPFFPLRSRHVKFRPDRMWVTMPLLHDTTTPRSYPKFLKKFGICAFLRAKPHPAMHGPKSARHPMIDRHCTPHIDFALHFPPLYLSLSIALQRRGLRFSAASARLYFLYFTAALLLLFANG